MITNVAQLNLINYKNCPQDEEIDQITDFHYNLYPEQKQVLYLMKTLEKQKSIRYKVEENNIDKIISYNKLVLGASFSFGKTIVSLALIKTKNDPIERDYYSFFNNEKYRDNKNDILELYVRRKILINTTLIIVSPSTFYQWVLHIKKCNLKVLEISNHEELDLLLVNLINNNLDKYDLVLLAYRKLKSSSPLPHGHIALNWSESTNISILSILSIDKVWKRVIIDDFDSINIYNDLAIPSRMIWLISTTANFMNVSKNIYHTYNCFDISAINHRIMDVTRDSYVTPLTIKANLDIQIPQIKISIYKFEYARTVNQVLNELNYPSDVCELINAGHISGAAVSLGISKTCNSLGEFLYLLIQKNKQSYINNIKICHFIEDFITIIDISYEQLVRHQRGVDELIMDEYISIIDFIKEVDLNKKYILWHAFVDKVQQGEEFITSNEYNDIKSLLEEYKATAGNFKHTLERIKRNLEDGVCCKCYCEPEGDRFILQCCNVLLCESCILRYNTHTFIERCPSCVKKIDKHCFIRMPNDISLDDFLDINYDDAFNTLRYFNSDILTDDNDEDPYEDLAPKERALIMLLNDKIPQECSIVRKNGLYSHNVIESEHIIDINDDINKKIIIFTKFINTANKLYSLLKKYNINSTILKGTNSKIIKKIIERFHYDNTLNVLLIPSQDICAGLDLEFATHIIFYHSIRNSYTTAQLIGRAQRIGRQCSLELIALENAHEISMFNVN